MRYLLDTCVISELIRKKPQPQVVAWVDRLHEVEAYLSGITIGEIKRGAEKLPVSERQQVICQWLENDLLIRFEKRILPVDTTVMLMWGQLVATLERAGRPLPAFDSLIAATALSGGLILVTRNVDDFAGVGVPIFNPWADVLA
jgi:predicted nucleic acid-binding protein